MSGRRYDREPAYDSYNPQHRRSYNERPYQDNQRGPPQRDRHARSPSPRRPYSPPHDQYRRQDGGELKIKGASSQRERNPQDVRDRNDSERDNEEYPRGRSRSRSPRGSYRRPYRDRDREGYRSSSYDSRDRSRGRGRYASRSRSHGRYTEHSPYYGGPPSREVILEGLPPNMTEEDISKELQHYHNVERLDDVRVIRDKQTKVSRCFGFIRFPSLEQSKSFIENNYPAIYLQEGDASSRDQEAAKIQIAYSRERGDRGPKEAEAGEWTCRCGFLNFPGRVRCRGCGNTPVDPSLYAATQARNQYVNSGDSDVAPDGTPSQFLIIRGLEVSVTEDLLAKGVSKLYKPSLSQSTSAASTKKDSNKVLSTTGDSNLGAREDSLRRVLLIRDRRTSESWRYGFAEFATIEDAQAALVRYSSFNRFTISSKPVTADYIHAGVFVPDLNATEDTLKFTFSPAGNTTTRFRYWDEQAYVSELVVSTDSSATDGNDIGQTRTAADDTAGFARSGKDGEGRANKKRKIDAKDSAKQKTTGASQLQFWSDRHAELHSSKKSARGRNEADQNAALNAPTTQNYDLPMDSFMEPATRCCFVCRQRWNTDEAFQNHQKTAKHRRSLLNNDMVKEAKSMQDRSTTELYVDLLKRCCFLCLTHFQTETLAVQHQLFDEGHRRNLYDNEAVELAKKNIAKPTCIDTARLCCFLCLEYFNSEYDCVNHELFSHDHQEMLKDEECVRLARTELALPNFSDWKTNVCYLCLEQFAGQETLNLHHVSSEKHKARLNDAEAVEKAKAQILKQSYADPTGKHCYLCEQHFEAGRDLTIHEAVDPRHNRSLQDDDLVQLANQKLRENGMPVKKVAQSKSGAEYRDRARERRQAFGKSKKISFTPKKIEKTGEDLDEGAALGSKGASLLNKMGWKAGEGLGAQGTGRTALIETNLYAQGVGLGAQGGKMGGATEEAERNTKSDYREFVEQTKDKAKARYESMT